MVSIQAGEFIVSINFKLDSTEFIAINMQDRARFEVTTWILNKLKLSYELYSD